MWPPENSAYFPKIKHMYVIPSVEIGVQPKCHGELSTFNSPQEESDFWYSGNCATKTDGETGRLRFDARSLPKRLKKGTTPQVNIIIALVWRSKPWRYP